MAMVTDTVSMAKMKSHQKVAKRKSKLQLVIVKNKKVLDWD
jgi:hypothetical protein